MHQFNLSESGDPGWRWAGGKELTSWGVLKDPLPESWHFSHLHKCLKTMKLRDRLLKKIMSYLSSCPHLCHPCPCPHSSRHPCRSLSSSAYIQLAFFSFSYFCHVLPCPHTVPMSSLSQLAGKCSGNSCYNLTAFSSQSFQEHNIWLDFKFTT